MVLGGFHELQGYKVWQPVVAFGEWCPPNKISPGPGGLDPPILESWRLGGLEGVSLAGWFLLWDGG